MESNRQLDKLAVYSGDEVAARYDERWSGRRGRARDRRKQRAVGSALALLGPVQSVLDVPCGTGRLTGLLSRIGGSYVGLDLAPAMLREARARHADAWYLAGDVARLPLADRSVDVAVCIRLMHLVRDVELRAAFLRELARVARVGVVVDFRHDRALRTWLGRVRARLGWRERPPNAHSLATVRAELEEAGLRTLAFVPVRRPAFLGDKMLIVGQAMGSTPTLSAHRAFATTTHGRV